MCFRASRRRGRCKPTVDLFLPFKDFVHRRVLVHGHLDGVTLNRTGSTVTATDLNGDFDIDGAQVARAEVRGRVLGGTFQMQARAPRNRPVTRTQLDFHGTLTGEALRAAMSLPAGISIGGQTRLARRAADGPRARIASAACASAASLAGLEIKLPAPLDKAPDTPAAVLGRDPMAGRRRCPRPRGASDPCSTAPSCSIPTRTACVSRAWR